MIRLMQWFCLVLTIIQFTIKMDFTANKPTRIRDMGTRQSNRNLSVHAVSPRDPPAAYDSPSLDKPVTFARTSDKENGTLRKRYEGSLVRSPIDPLVASRASAIEERQHRGQVEALLLQVGYLRGLLLESSEQQAHELARIKQGYQESNFLQMSSFRQKENTQVQIHEFQLRKLKEQLAEKAVEHERLEVQLERERRSHQQEKETLKEEVKVLIGKKNAQICDLKQELEERVRKVVGEKEQEIGEVKYNCSRELANINKILQNKSRQLDKLSSATAQGEAERQKLLEKLHEEREEIQRRYEQRIAEQYEKYENLKGNFNKLIAQTTQMEENNWQQLQEMFNSQYSNIFQLVRHKDSEVAELRKQMELEQVAGKAQKEAVEQECQLLKQKLKEQAIIFQQEIELLKVKIAALHQADLQKVKELYQLRLNNALEGNGRLQSENNKLREMIQLANSQRYQLKQRHDVITSELNSKILKMRMGIHSLQSDFKEKLQNEKSLMLMTSRSFLKDAEVKNHNNKFLEQQIRKLRQLMDLQTRQNENAEKAVEQKILAANNQLERLSSRVVNIAQEKKELEQAIDALRRDKDREIARLKAELNEVERPEHNNSAELQIIEELKEERHQKLEQIGKLKDKLSALESCMKEMKAEVERANMEAQINHQQGKKQYHEIAEAHLSEFKKFYEDKLKRVEEEKEELKKIINSQYQQITQLIKKYKQLEQGMKDAVSLMKKRTVLEEKVMNLGMDNNLIKNLTQLLPGFPSQ